MSVTLNTQLEELMFSSQIPDNSCLAFCHGQVLSGYLIFVVQRSKIAINICYQSPRTPFGKSGDVASLIINELQ